MESVENNENKKLKIKLCRQCHIKYKRFEQKFCGNGCEQKPPYIPQEGIKIIQEPREIILEIDNNLKDNYEIRWLCLQCSAEIPNDEMGDESFKCPMCDKDNDFICFTEKTCSLCLEKDGTYHKLPINAKSCEICGKAEFLYNGKKLTDFQKRTIIKERENAPNAENLDETIDEKNQNWNAIPTEIKEKIEKEPENKNILSLTISILNNNLEYIIYGESKAITLKNLIKDGKGFIPDSIYLSLLNEFDLTMPLFEFNYISEPEHFTFKSKFNFEMIELDARYQPKKGPNSWKAGLEHEIPEGKLAQLQGDFFKINLWAY